jgi:hypothetical protein
VKYDVVETRANGGWSSTFLLQPQELAKVPGPGIRATARDLARIERDGQTGEIRYFSRDGARINGGSSGLVEQARAGWPGEFPPMPLRMDVPSPSSLARGRQGVVVGQLLRADSSGSRRAALRARYGSPEIDASGHEVFGSTVGDTTRTLTYDPAFAAVSRVRVSVGSRVLTQVDFGFNRVTNDLPATTSVRSVREARGYESPRRLIVTTVTWTNIRLFN